MAFVPWMDEGDNKITDENGIDIIFKRIIVQMQSESYLSATGKVIQPSSGVSMVGSGSLDPTGTVRIFGSVSMISSNYLNPNAKKIVGSWDSLMLKYIGDRNIG